MSANSCISAALFLDVRIFFAVRRHAGVDVLLTCVAVSVVLSIHQDNSFLVYHIFDCCVIVIKPILTVLGLIAKCFFAYFGNFVVEPIHPLPRDSLLVHRSISLLYSVGTDGRLLCLSVCPHKGSSLYRVVSDVLVRIASLVWH